VQPHSLNECLCDCVTCIKRKKASGSEALLVASKEAGPEVNPEKTKYCVLMSRYQKAGQNLSIKVANRSSEDVAQFKRLVTTLTDQNCMQEEIKSRLNSGNACYHSVQSPSVFPPAV
jgi:hypothetical protein